MTPQPDWLVGFGMVARVLAALLFGFSGLGKAASLKATASGLSGYWVPAWARHEAAVTLCVLELFLAIALLSGLYVRIVTVLAMVVLLCFSAAVALRIVAGHVGTCNCFGPLLQEQIGLAIPVRNVLICSAMAPAAVLATPAQSWAIALPCVVLASLIFISYAQLGRLLGWEVET